MIECLVRLMINTKKNNNLCFADLYISNVFSCPFSNTSVTEDGEKNLKTGSTVLGMS